MLTVSLARTGSASAADPPSGPAILEQLRAFRELRSVLHIAAHPDDENTQLITFLARGLHVRTAYLSITRGDGGQNLLGPEFGDELGLIRTQELLSARRLDGGLQFFTRAVDFGFSKDYEDTLRVWGAQEVLSDVVRIIRGFQPDVIVTRFNPSPGRTHGHHTASAVLAVKAFEASADPNAFPEQGLEPWRAKRVLQSGGFGGSGGGGGPTMDLSGDDPVLGESYGSISSRSRAMHKSQGFGNFGGGGGGRRGGSSGPRLESFQLLAGEPAKSDIFEGVDNTWVGRVTADPAVSSAVDDLVAKFNPEQPAASVPAIVELHKVLSDPNASRLIRKKRRQLESILQACLGLTVETTVANAEAVPGEKVTLTHTATVRSDIPVEWVAVRYPTLKQEVKVDTALKAGQAEPKSSSVTIPATQPLSQPFWLRETPGPGMHRVPDPAFIGRPENSPAIPVELVFELSGLTFPVADEPVAIVAGPNQSTIRRRLDIVAPVALSFDYGVAKFIPGQERPVHVHATAVRAGVSGQLKLQTPAGWKVSPASQPFKLSAVGESAALTFAVTAPADAKEADLTAHAEVGGATFSNRRKEINYAHLPPLLLQPPARLNAMPVDLAIRGKTVGYISGAGDTVDKCLAEMGYTVKELTAADLNAEGLKGFDAVVIGVRAFNVREDLGDKMPALFAFAEAGGNLIVQYNRPEGLKSSRFAPYDLHLTSDRVTDEEAAPEIIAPDHPVLNTPNKITRADFDGWVQERGIYFPDQWGEQFQPVVAFRDRGEIPLKSGILVAPHGKGHVVYTSLVWFRELPAGVPGAYRLFANLVSLGK